MEKQVNRLQTINMIVLRQLNRLIFIFMFLLSGIALAQEKQEIYDYTRYDNFVIGSITITGVRFLDPNALIGISGLRVGQRISIPGDAYNLAAQKLWQQGLFSDIRMSFVKASSDTILLDIELQERPRISSVKYNGLKRSESKDLVEKINLPVGSQVTPYLLNTANKIIVDHFVGKGFLNTEVNYIQKDDPDYPNNVILTVEVDKKEKVKISEIMFLGNEYFKASKLRKKMKGTKVKNINFFRASKLVDDKFEEDKQKLITFYNDNGFKDFTILSDTVYNTVKKRFGIIPVNSKNVPNSPNNRVGLTIRVDEGDQYFLRNVEWVGNSVYRKEDLERVFNIKKGSVYNQSLINDRLNGTGGAPDAVSSLYQDHGYLFSRLTPVEANVENDSVDLEIRIYEGDQAYLNDIFISGNTRTNEHVARREMFTLPGDLFSRDKIIRTIRQLGVINLFEAEKINPVPLPDMANGTVDLLYKLEERASDQFEVSGGWGAGMFVGTIGVTFNNVSVKNFFDLKEWKPYPSGDGQSLGIRMQTNGKMYQSYSISFMEPWLGGKRPNSLSSSLYRSNMSNGESGSAKQSMTINGATIGLGKRLEWPDNFFSIYGELGYQHYYINNYQGYFVFTNGTSNMLSLTGRFARNSVGPNLIYPRSGSSFALSLQITPPWSYLAGKDLSNATDQEKYKWIEFHKWVFKSDYYFPLTLNDKLVLNASAAFGYLGHFNPDIGPSPFEFFYIGGDGMTGYSFLGREVIPLRGYTNGSLTPYNPNRGGSGALAGNVYSKITFELRYPISLNPQATVYVLTFLESGRAWYALKEFSPFNMPRVAGVGVRANLPMFGLLGIDWGYGFDSDLQGGGRKGEFHFKIGQQF